MLRSRPRRHLALITGAALLASLTAATVAAPASAAKPRCQGLPATIVGSARSEIIQGTAGRDIIVAKGGNDRIYAKGGNDVICAGGGNDIVYGGPGADRLWGQLGHDRLNGNAGNDFLAGQVGNDTLNGGINFDRCFQGTGTGPLLNCELPPPPTPGSLVIGGSTSGQVAHSFYSTDNGATWNSLTDCSVDADGGELRRLALEFPLSGLPAGATVTKATLSIHHYYRTQLAHSLRGYPGNGTIELPDILVGDPVVSFAPSPDGTRTSVDVTSLVTPTVVASGWAGLAMRRDVDYFQPELFGCKSSDPNPPILTIDYLTP